jgi:hypothetical protein
MVNHPAPDTLIGSFTPSLQLSKLWMCGALKRLMHKENISKFNTVYSLGSWYGNMALFMLIKQVPFRTMVDVDLNTEYLATSKYLMHKLYKQGRLISVAADANTIAYDAPAPSLVINNSTNNMRNAGWLSNIPTGTWVAMQGRSNEPQNRFNTAHSLSEFDQQYPLSETLLLSGIPLSDPDDQYVRWMKIGVK